jgi:hypothetical protein
MSEPKSLESGGLIWRLKKGAAGVKPVEDLAGLPQAD